MKKFFIIILSIIVIVLAVLLIRNYEANAPTNNNGATTTATSTATSTDPLATIPKTEIIVQGLNIPWDLAFLPDGDLLVTERVGRLVRIKEDGTKSQIPIAGVRTGGEGGLLGLTLHPRFEENQFIYIYLGTPSGSGTTNRVERYKLSGNQLSDKKIIIQGIPGALYHDGGRIEFGPDDHLYITTGDATNENLAQDRNSLAGKILRVTEDGAIPTDNPFQSAVYSYGHRNPQGLAWDTQGKLWSTEHGRSGVQSGLDELNLIEIGKNYGWPTIEGDEKRADMVTPVLNSGANDTWAPASLVFLNGKFYFGGLRGEALYEATPNGLAGASIKKHLFQEFGRIRTVRVGPDNLLYITTSNRDGRGNVRSGDDKIIRVNPSRL